MRSAPFSSPEGVAAQTATDAAECTWQAPEFAPHPIDHYRVELQKRVGDRVLESTIHDNLQGDSLQLDLEYGYSYRVRVLAVDVDGREGPWSPWSMPYSPDAKLGEFLNE